MNKIMLSCLEASKLSALKSFRKLKRKEKIQLTLHHSMCHACRKFDSQSAYIDHAIYKYFNEIEFNASVSLSEDKKRVMQQAINQSLEK